MGNIVIKIEGKPLRYDFEFNEANTSELSKALAYLEIIRQKLIIEIEEKEKKYEKEER